MPVISASFLSTPRVVATVHRPEDLQFLARADPGPLCDVLEFRLDNLAPIAAAAADTAAKLARQGFPLLITARHPAEGGANDLSVAERESLLRQFLPLATLIDIEVRALDELSGVLASARDEGVTVVASSHDFDGTPPASAWRAARDCARNAGAEVLKLALRLDRLPDLFELAAWVESLRSSGENIAAMGMGPLGKLSRLMLARAGSCLNYGFLEKANAPGQWPASELKRLLAEIL
ncbi:MAG: type I 3-dehydroquinate dehydratase [Akkermansiaceae bacterium]|nr:type I 3-dehydroquinate dehydratase [Akkermansiaceae bacterium]MCP5551749.1 type I 3-dehydroquinate dehydratase [Akkermansiaceae bacterium]